MKIVLLATLLFTTHALCPRAHAVSPRQVIKWATNRMADDEMLRRVKVDKSSAEVTLQEIANMRIAGVPEAVIDFMVNVGARHQGQDQQSKPGDSGPVSETAPSRPTSPAAVPERLTIAVAMRLAKRHRESQAAFIAALSATRGQIALTKGSEIILIRRAQVTAEQIYVLRDHNTLATCLYTSDCLGGAQCIDGGCHVPKKEKTEESSPAWKETKPSRSSAKRAQRVESRPGSYKRRHRHRFGKGFIMGGLGLTRSTGLSPATDGSEAEEESELNVDLALRIAFVSSGGFYVGGRAWYDSSLADGDGDGSGALLLGYLATLSHRYPLFLDVRGDVSSVNDKLMVSAGLGLAVALGKEHPIFLHTELVSVESGGASSRGNVSMGIRFK